MSLIFLTIIAFIVTIGFLVVIHEGGISRRRGFLACGSISLPSAWGRRSGGARAARPNILLESSPSGLRAHGRGRPRESRRPSRP
jgi:hypothetical protein